MTVKDNNRLLYAFQVNVNRTLNQKHTLHYICLCEIQSRARVRAIATLRLRTRTHYLYNLKTCVCICIVIATPKQLDRFGRAIGNNFANFRWLPRRVHLFNPRHPDLRPRMGQNFRNKEFLQGNFFKRNFSNECFRGNFFRGVKYFAKR